ncbi:polyprenyl synthetase family protein [Paenibacillus sp. RC67]|uniref:polyprenyl synthetase family protein n=1 Tax=Paenibacillus sp. RC67 TaxID=3039392 RepID=UPI0024ACA837|nr:farnesyl diphosphate synthase [Paenibacillus sp. RC67]
MSTDASIRHYLEQKTALIEAELAASLPEIWNIPDSLRESMMYSLLAGGKRLRPVLVLAAVEALRGSTEEAIPVALAVEMIHTYSLIHDDLPAMDNDDYRRGKLTNHKVYGEAMAILAGDGLLTHAFYSIVQAYRAYDVPAEKIVEIVEDLSKLAGAPGMVGGQAADMLGEQGITGLEQLEYIHLHKTSDLIVFALKAGGHLGGATPKQLQALEKFGQHVGLAFQIQDDILDLIGDEEKLGKPVKSDEKQQKVTYPYFVGIDASKEKVSQLTDQGKQALIDADFPYVERLLQLADYLLQRDH